MTEGPFGGPRPFVSDKKSVLVLVGLQKTEPPTDILINAESVVEIKINDVYNTPGADTVSLTTNDNPTDEQIEAVGNTALHIQQYEVKTPVKKITQKQINGIHNTVIEKLNELGFSVTGSRTTVI